MRIVQGLFVVSMALLVFGIGFIVVGARGLQQRAPIESSITVPVASIRQIMNGITGPAARAVYSSVATVVNKEGVKEIAPQTDEEWAALADSAAALVESGNLLLLDGRALDNGDWVTMTRALMDEGQKALKAAQAKDKEGILSAGETINVTCDTCHERYQRQ